jgi:UDP-N-acetylglucosamine 3-dehydrogenase
MSAYRTAVIGAGRPACKNAPGGMAMGEMHAAGLERIPNCRLAAVADIEADHAEAFIGNHPGARPFLNHCKMLHEIKPDIVCVCVPTQAHYLIVMDCIAAGAKAVHCEKPMAMTMGEARRMTEFAESSGVQLTFNHQRRFGSVFRKAKEVLDSGSIGSLARCESVCPNLFDRGCHFLDLLFFYNNDKSAEWVLGQIDSRTDRELLGVRLEDQSITQVRFSNGIDGLLTTGAGQRALGCKVLLIGTEGEIHVGLEEGPVVKSLRWRTDSAPDWQRSSPGDCVKLIDMTALAIQEMVSALDEGRPSQVAARRALQTAEAIFATYESSRRRKRIDLPLAIDDSPFHTMLAEGAIGTSQTER